MQTRLASDTHRDLQASALGIENTSVHHRCHLLQTWDFGEESVTLIKSNGGGEVGGIGGSKPGTSQRIKTNFYQLFINLPSSPGQGKKNSGKAKAKTWL